VSAKQPDLAMTPTATVRGVERSAQASRDATADAIVVSNTLWQAADPEAYDGGRPSDITHLAEFEASGLAAVTTRAGRAPSRSSRRKLTSYST
jgi:hypothetical protein